MNPLIHSYEHAQDLAGEAFTDLGFTRGARDAEARQEAKRTGEPVPAKRRHVPPSQWGAEQKKLARAEAQQTLEDEKQKADRIVEEGRTLARATARKSRKRAIKEARERKDRAAREAKICAALEIEHRLAPPKSPQANGMVERFNGRIEECCKATISDQARNLRQRCTATSGSTASSFPSQH